MLDSFTSSLFKTNDFSTYGVWVNHTVIPADHPLKLNTDALGYLFPEVPTKFGKGKPVDIHFELRGLKNFKAQESSQSLSLDADIGMKFCVDQADGTKVVAIDTTFESFNVEFSAALTDMTLKANLTKTSFSDIKIVKGSGNIALV